MLDRRLTYLASLALFALTMIWSYNWVIMKSVLAYMSALDFAALRCVLGAVFLLIMFPLTGRNLKPLPWRPVLSIGILQGGGMTALGQLALVSGGAGKTAVLVYTMPFWMILFAALFLGETPRKMQYVATGLGAIGLLLVIEPWQMNVTLTSSLLAIAAGASWAAGSVITKRLCGRQPVDLMSLTAWQIAVGAVMLAVLALVAHKQPIVWSNYAYVALAYNAVMATALAWALWLFVLRVLPAGVAGLSTLLVPVMSVLWAWWLLGETPDLAENIGIGLILLALLFISVPTTFWLRITGRANQQ